MSIRYIYLRNNTYYYQRKIPLDLLERHNGITHIKLNLKSTDLREVASKVDALNKHYESTWESMRRNPNITPTNVRESAIRLLSQYGLKPLPALNPQDHIEHFFDYVVESKRYKAAQGDDETYRTITPEEYLTPTEIEAGSLLLRVPKLHLSEALSIYLKGHPKKNDQTFIRYSERTWKKLVDILGDKPFDSVNRTDANSFIDELLSKGNKTGTVKRSLSVINAVFKVVILEKELQINNPFLSLRIPGLGSDFTKRYPFDSSELTLLGKACRALDDDMRWLIALQMNSGSRLGELVGLLLDDIRIDSELPYIIIQPHKWRSLKNGNSARCVPLVGTSLWAARRVLDNATKGQIYAFPRYTDGNTCKATAASGALNNWIKSQKVLKTTHSFRHAMRDRLRNVNAPKTIQDAVGGWGKQDEGEKYGEGYWLATLREWLDKVVI